MATGLGQSIVHRRAGSFISALRNSMSVFVCLVFPLFVPRMLSQQQLPTILHSTFVKFSFRVSTLLPFRVSNYVYTSLQAQANHHQCLFWVIFHTLKAEPRGESAPEKLLVASVTV